MSNTKTQILLKVARVFTLGLALSLAITVVIQFFGASSVQAQSASWVDSGTIRWEGENYIDPKPQDGTHKYFKDGDQSNCGSRKGPYLDFLESSSGNPFFGDRNQWPDNPEERDEATIGFRCAGSPTSGNRVAVNNTQNASKPPGSGGGAPTHSSNPQEVGGEAPGPQCEGADSLGWIMCPIINTIVNGVKNIEDTFLNPLLRVRPLGGENTQQLEKIWGAFRNIANGFFILVFMYIIFAQASSFNVDAYTIKKTLPKLIISVIIVQLSFFISAITVDIFNVLGQGIDTLIENTVTTPNLAVNGNLIGGLLVGAAGTALITGISAFALLPLLVTALLAILFLFAVLIARQVVIALFVIISPIAFVAFVLPNTEKFFYTWWNWFVNTLMIYPLVMLLLGSSDLLGAAAGGIFEGNSAIGTLATIVATIAPLFLIPFVLKVANGALGAVVGGLDTMKGRAAGGRDGRGGLRGWADKKANQLNREAKAGTITGNERLNRIAQGMTNPGSFIPSRSERLAGTPLGGAYERTLGRAGTRSRAQALTNFNQLQAQANETLDEEQVNDPRVLRGLVQHGESGPTMRNYINSLRERGQNDLADQMESVAGHAGKAAFLSAAATRLGESGRFNQEDADALVGTFSNNPALLQQTLGNAGYQNRKNGNIANSYWRALRDNEGNITSVAPDRERIRDQVSRMGKEEIDDERYLDQASPFMHEIFQGGGPQAQDLEVNLRQTLHPQSGIDATKRQQVRQILEQNGRPVEPMASPVNVEEVAGHQTQPGPTPDDPSLHVRVQQRSDQPPPDRDEGYL